MGLSKWPKSTGWIWEFFKGNEDEALQMLQLRQALKGLQSEALISGLNMEL